MVDRKTRDPEGCCQHCGRIGCAGPLALDIPVQKGHVQRAIRAADAVYEAAADGKSDSQVEPGMVLMTALLLVERLAVAHDCAPASILQKMASCFEFKQQHAAALKHCN